MSQKDVDGEFATGWSPLPVPESYYPTRLEYFAGKALEGMLAGKSLKDYPNCVRYALDLARQMEAAIDATKTGR